MGINGGTLHWILSLRINERNGIFAAVNVRIFLIEPVVIEKLLFPLVAVANRKNIFFMLTHEI